MGTSSSFGGQKGGTPLIPSWLGDGDTAPSSNGNDSSQGDGTADGSTDAAQPATANPPTAPVPQSAPPTRFQASRTNFTRFVKSGGQDRASLGRAMSGYVSTASGGARTAAQKMGASRAGGVNLANFLANVRTQGVTTALQSLNLDTLAGRPIEEVFLGLIDYVCPENGSIDAGIARDAFVETIVDLAELGITDLNTLTADQMQTVLELYVTHKIEARP